ncbi:MAG: IS1 family transposase, partial [Armatimonadetes bacterium]|nr:IS1 family transposase [Armatimonadota bacterium]MBV9852202.1 IS1 family transposase [Armatimonadota bacterium]
MIALSCPHCGDTDVIKFGTNRSGTPRCRCKACAKTF